ncbi:MAG: TetR/AcrR family transcriptional regulator [Dehalococcoidia bacterium]
MRTKNSPSVREQPSFIEAARKAQIIDATIEVIAELGFANASLAQIAKRAGISKGVIGYYFPSKDDLVRAAVEAFYLTGHEEMMADVQKATTPTEMLRLYIRHNIGYIDRNRQATKVMGEIIQNFRTPSGELVYKPEDAEPMVAGTAALFDWGQNTGEFRKHDSRVLAVMLRAAMDAFAGQLAIEPDLDVEHQIEEVTEMFLGAVRKQS